MGEQAVKATVDTNVLVRAVVKDHKQQGEAAAKLMREAAVLAISTPGLCEFVWVLGSGYKYRQADIVDAIETLLAIPSVRVNVAAVEAGLKLMKSGGDFADGVLAHEGRWLGGETFVSFDRKAVALLQGQGESAHLLA